MTDETPSIVRQAFADGLRAARTNLLPGMFLVACGITLVAAYYRVEAVAEALNTVGRLKDRWGFAFSIPSTAFFGGVLPIVFRKLFLQRCISLQDLMFNTAFWAEKGFEVDVLYRIQAWLFGEGADAATIVKKVLVDQFVYLPAIAIPTMVLAYLWKDCGFSLGRTRVALRQRGYWPRAINVMISNWGVWIPAVAIIYCFPLPLQLPLQNLTLTLWVMLLFLLVGEPRNEPASGPD